MKTFNQFLIEAKPPKEDAHKTMTRNWERRPGHKGLNVYITKSETPYGPHYKIHDLFIPPHLRGKGVGTKVMKGATKMADKSGATMSLNQAPEKGYKGRLKKFYKGFNFVPNKGKNKDFTTTDSYIRKARR